MPQKDQLTYEKAIARLEQIVQLLQSGEQNIDESMELFKESVELSSFCFDKLNKYESEIKILTEDGESDFES